jgi:6-phospho-3-hexuloisomerase
MEELETGGNIMSKQEIINELRNPFMATDEQELDTLCDYILKAPKIFVYSRGRVFLALKAFCARLNQLGLTARAVAEITTPHISKDDLLVVGNSLGFPSTIDRFIKIAKSCEAKVIAFTINPTGPGLEECDGVVTIEAKAFTAHPEDFENRELSPAEKNAVRLLNIPSVQPMCSTFEQLVLLTTDYVLLKLQTKMNQRKAFMDELEKNFLQVNDQELDGLIDLIEKANKIFFFSQGREVLILSAFAMRVFHMGYDVYIIGEPHVPPIGKGDLLVMSLGTGAFSEIAMAQFKMAKNAGASVVAITDNIKLVPKDVNALLSVPGKTILGELDSKDFVQFIDSAYERAELITLDYTVKRMMERNNWVESDLFTRHTNMD